MKNTYFDRSFGILVWEILTLGYQPYPGMDNQEVIEHVKSGGTLEIPQKCPLEMSIFEILLKFLQIIN